MNGSMDVAVSFSDNATVFAPMDVFTCGMGLYAYLRRLPYAPSQPLTESGAAVMEIVALESSRLGKGLRDYCLIATPDIVARMKAEKRRAEGLSDENGLSSVNLNDARTLEDVEAALGCPVLKHPSALAALYYHDRIPR